MLDYSYEHPTFEVACVCPVCGEVTFIEVRCEDWDEWGYGKSAQQAFPYLTATERETLISGLCEECQNDVFGE